MSLMQINNDELKYFSKLELARRDFFYYCNLRAPDFYREDRPYIKTLCNRMQEFYEGNDEVMIINVPPRHGKSRTAILFSEWLFGQNINEKIMTAAYNETVSTTFSKSVRNDINEIKAEPYKAVYSDVFPETRIKSGDGAMNLWSLEGGYSSYLATSPTGTATGFGCSFMIIDDLIKNALEANNARVLDEHWRWFTDTMLSRLEEGGKIIIIMTRWHSEDLSGRILDWCKEENKKYQHISMSAVVDEEKQEMLCPDILSYKTYIGKIKIMGEDIASANYNQEPIDLKGNLYTHFKTYKELPSSFSEIKAYCDTADTGKDYLCMLVFGIRNKEAYVLDIVYTQKPMEYTEKAVAKSLYENKVNVARIEANNGGRGFGRSVERILSEKYRTNRTKIKCFHNSKNKESRIISNSTWVMEHIYFPENWRIRWKDYYKTMIHYQREGRNKHDDAPDATTGVAETILEHQSTFKTFRGI